MRMPPKNRRALAELDWPELDRQAWREANRCANDDLLFAPRPALNWRPSSKELFVRYYGIWLDWLKREGELEAETHPGDRVSTARLTRYLRAQRERGVSAKTLVSNAVSLRHMFEALAPNRDWSWMLPMIRKLKTFVVVAKNHSDLPQIGELFALGVRMMRLVEGPNDGSQKQRALMFRNGLTIAMLAARPMMRRENLARLRIGVNLVREGKVYVLKFSGEEMKGKRRTGAPLPAMLTPFVERYLDVWRPILLLGKPGDHGVLLISMMGLPLYPHAMSNEIGRVTQTAFGRRVCVHEFRHAAGSSIAKEAPERVDTVTAVLGHADYRTSESYYVFADEHAAFVRLDRALAELTRVRD